jgi:Fe-S-cluster-containing hydrogenase component 2
MKATTVRKIVKIDESKCNGCGLCVPSCAEGAIAIIDGKARLVADNLCDGLGNCLGACPQGAITIQERPAEAFDLNEQAVRPAPAVVEERSEHDGASGECPGRMVRMLRQGGHAQTAAAGANAGQAEQSRLRHWPVQLALLPVRGAMWAGADVLLAADCVAVAVPDFQQRLLVDKTVAVACPKLDDASAYIQKLATIFAANDIRSVTVAHMEVPCCFGLVRIVQAALEQAGKSDIPLHDVTVGIDGRVQE